MKSMLMIAVATALVAPAVALAAPKPEASATRLVASAGAAATTAKPKRYCVVSTPTGSRLERRDCKTLDAWLAEGFDPRNPQ